jgi:DNA-directed RNA polymerase specialized sigma24 family protein
MIHHMAKRDARASDEFVQMWDGRIQRWVSQRVGYEKIEEYSQEVWGHLVEGNWLRLLQWNGLFDDDAWNPHSLEAFLKKLTNNKVTDLLRAEPPQLPPGLDPVDIIDRTTPYGRDPLLEAERSRLMWAYEDCTQWFKDKDNRLITMWWEGHAGQYIATQLKMKVNNVYQRRSYLLNQLRDCLVDKLPEYFHRV